MANSSSYSTLISARALKEIEQSWLWYEERQQGLGDRFKNEVFDKIKKIEQNPDRHPTRFRSYKEAVVPVFPFLVIYRINKRNRTIRITSVFHTRLNPKKKY